MDRQADTSGDPRCTEDTFFSSLSLRDDNSECDLSHTLSDRRNAPSSWDYSARREEREREEGWSGRMKLAGGSGGGVILRCCWGWWIKDETWWLDNDGGERERARGRCVESHIFASMKKNAQYFQCEQWRGEVALQSNSSTRRGKRYYCWWKKMPGGKNRQRLHCPNVRY